MLGVQYDFAGIELLKRASLETYWASRCIAYWTERYDHATDGA